MVGDQGTDGNAATELARERSRLAADRTLLAWIRTALALIGFGFSLAKVSSFLAEVNPNRTRMSHMGTRAFCAAFVSLGTFSLLVAVLQHWRALRQIARDRLVYAPAWPLSELVSVVLVLIGIYGLVAVLK